MSTETLELTPREIRNRQQAGKTLSFIDVREPEEYQVARLEEAILIPMRAIPAQLQDLEAKADEHDLILFCHHGMRSLQVAAWLREHGVPNCFSMSGGIDRWSAEIDSRVPRY